MKKINSIVMFLLLSATILAAPLKVGLILAMGGLGDKSFNDSAYAGLLKAQKDFDIEVKYVEPNSWMEDAYFLEEYSQNGFDLIIATSYTAQDAMEDISTKFPNTKYAIVDTRAKEGANIASLVFDESEGSFLVGAIAAKMSKTGKVGFIGALDIPLINRFKSGYEQGAKYVNPDIEVITTYVGGDAPFSDPLKGKEHAYSLANQGIDVIYHASGNTGIGILEGVKEKGIYGIGVDCDQDDIVKGQILTSMLKNVNNAIYKVIEDTVNGEFKGQVYNFGLKENGIGTTDFKYTKEVIGSENIKFVEKLKEDIISGKIKVN
ncbi:MAG: BMP family lipoprotein [Cetobacterium sp.]|uniref:BMP family lipoprotein n=2 Tax=Fusobacteriaceae TaxID=203492 RepID=UPI001F06C302|nr:MULTISPECIES: BMP family ABC transporter substrate-binding protein [Cetobacterium]MCX3066920.1 BMP family ABC transporter substrate-binding protein [Cetobacterium somerae]UPO98381.1 BMP family ABC transporter substrate-binding protein [Cetobacterium somerae]